MQNVSSDTIRILLVEDDEMDAELFLRNIRKAWPGLVCERVQDRQAFVAHLESRQWDLVIADYNVPGFGPFELLETLKERGSDLAVIVISGAVGEEVAAKLMKVGAADFVRKANYERLVPTIRRARREKAIELREREAKRRAEEAVNARQEILSIVSHDMKNPLSAMRLQLDYLKRVTTLDRTKLSRDDLLDQIGKLSRSVDRMTTLIQDVLDLSKIESNNLAVQTESNHPIKLLSDLVSSFEAIASERGVSLEADYANAPETSVFDYHRIFQALSNLIGNALKFSSQGGRVLISCFTAPEDSALVFEVTDTGPGIAEEELPHLFDRFWQSKQNRTGGSGLGLYIAKAIVEAHGGEITAGNVRNGNSGAVFTLRIPDRQNDQQPGLTTDPVDIRDAPQKLWGADQ